MEEKLGGKELLEDIICEDSVKMNLRETDCEVMK
jgi:hypothetical protein